MKNVSIVLAIIAAGPALAEGTRELDAHEHGVGALNIAFDGNNVAMEFQAPGADIVGFEYSAESDTDIAAVQAALDTLSNPLSLFVMPEAAECSVVDGNGELSSSS